MVKDPGGVYVGFFVFFPEFYSEPRRGPELLFKALQSLVPLCFAGSEKVGKGFLRGGGAIKLKFLHNIRHLDFRALHQK